jgi:branched-chain amino acid transport system permease protein
MADLITSNVATLNFILIDVALALSIYVTLACGLLSLANAGFLAIGAYTAAICATQMALPLAAGFFLAVMVATLVALGFGLVVLRLRALYLAIATLGFGEIVRLLALNGDKILSLFADGNRPVVFNGGEGITLPYHAPATVLGLPDTTWPILLYVLATVYVLATLEHSQTGRVFGAIRLDEAAAATLGIDVVRSKLLAFTLGSAIAAGAGALSVPIIRVIDPSNYTFDRAVGILASSVLGGMTHWIGPIVGAMILTALPELLRSLQAQRDVVNGLIIMLSIIYLPRGLADPHFWRNVWRQRGKSNLFVAFDSSARATSTAIPPRPSDAPPRGEPLSVRDVSRVFGGLTAVDNVSFDVAPGTICGLIGPNGAGKTTLLNVISGLISPSTGTVQLGSQILSSLPPHLVAVAGVARTFQSVRLFGDLSVLDNVMVGIRSRRRNGVVETLLCLPRGRAEEQALRQDAVRLLQRLGLAHLAEDAAGGLSYGDQRRVEIARALARAPRILLLDEPAAGLNPTETGRLAELLLELRRAGLALVVIEHDMSLIRRVCDNVVVLNFGRKIAEGPPDAIRLDRQVVEAYLGGVGV